MKKLLFLILLSFLNLSIAEAQKTIVLNKLDSKRRYEFSEGEKLRLKLKGSKEVLEGSWWYDHDEETIVLGGQEVELADIYWLDISDKENGIYLLRKGQDLFLLAGAGYFFVNHVNVLIDPGDFRFDKQVTRTSAAFVFASFTCGALDRAFRKRKVRIGEGMYSISLIDSPEL